MNKEGLLVFGVLAVGSSMGGHAEVPSYQNTPAHVVYIDRPIHQDGPVLLQKSDSSFNISELDPSEYPLGGKIASVLFFATLVALSYDMWKKAKKLRSDADLQLSSKAVAVCIGMIGLYGLFQTFTDIPR